MKKLLLLFIIFASFTAQAQELTVSELRVAHGPADRVVVFLPGSCEGSITRNGGAYAINTDVDPITFTWVGGTDAGTLNRRIFDELESNQEHGVVYQHNRSLIGGNIIFQYQNPFQGIDLAGWHIVDCHRAQDGSGNYYVEHSGGRYSGRDLGGSFNNLTRSQLISRWLE